MAQPEQPEQKNQNKKRTVNRQLRHKIAGKYHIELPKRPCGPPKVVPVGVDLVILTDTSDSFGNDVIGTEDDLLRLLQATIDNAVHKVTVFQREPALNVTWLGIEGRWPGTAVTQTHRDYLRARGITDASLLTRHRGTVPNQGAQEDGLRAMLDLVRHFDWRPDALRLILYLSDEALDGETQLPGDLPAERSQLAAEAQAQQVKIYTYAGSKPHSNQPDPSTILEFTQLAKATGGDFFSHPATNINQFYDALLDLLLWSVDPPQGFARPDTLRPTFMLRWGDAPDDKLEVADAETLYLIASNPFSNMTFCDVTITDIQITDRVGNWLNEGADCPPAPLGILPKVIQFGTLPPTKAGKPTAVGREALLIASDEIEADRYIIEIFYLFWAQSTQFGRDEFKLKLVKN